MAKEVEKRQVQKTKERRDSFSGKIKPKAISITRNDIKTWKNALRSAQNVDNPRRAKLYNLYDDVLSDAHLHSQITIRNEHTLSVPFALKNADGSINDQTTDTLNKAAWVNQLNSLLLWSKYYGHCLIEFTTNPYTNELEVVLFPRNNIVPEKGLILMSEDDTKGVEYRALKEYTTWILEFGENKDFGIINKAVPHVLFKRFAQACWSELCEIYGIPPRYIKTDTQDPEMLDRCEAMMRDLGSAAWFIIDTSEEFNFGKGADTNGDVYKNLIALCKEEISLLINGAVVGQDTVNGNRSKEESSLSLVDKGVVSDKKMLTTYWNGKIIPALERIGLIPKGLYFEFQQEEDIEKLWSMTKEALPYMRFKPEWIRDKFGLEVEGMIESRNANLSHTKKDDDFFD